MTRVVDFGAFVELEPGVEGLIHLSEMSWAKKVRQPSDVVKPGETVEAVVLTVESRRAPYFSGIEAGARRSMGRGRAEVQRRFGGRGQVASITNCGAFVQLSEGIEGMIHVSEMSAEKRINHPQEVLKVGQVVQAQVLAIDKDRRQLRLGMKQLVPTGLDEYIAEHKPGDTVSGRVIDISDGRARVELGEGIQGISAIAAEGAATEDAKSEAGRYVSPEFHAEGALERRRCQWRRQAGSHSRRPVRSFKITKLDGDAKTIELELT